jgi:hypothetical protein
VSVPGMSRSGASALRGSAGVPEAVSGFSSTQLEGPEPGSAAAPGVAPARCPHRLHHRMRGPSVQTPRSKAHIAAATSSAPELGRGPAAA